MERLPELNRRSAVIKGALCAWDLNHGMALTAAHAAQALETLLDKYHFGDPPKAGAMPGPIAEGYIMAEAEILRELSDVAPEVLEKVLSAIYFVLRRRGMRGRDYFDIIHRFMGASGKTDYMRRFHAEEVF
jgi:hypothetical protein